MGNMLAKEKAQFPDFTGNTGISMLYEQEHCCISLQCYSHNVTLLGQNVISQLNKKYIPDSIAIFLCSVCNNGTISFIVQLDIETGESFY